MSSVSADAPPREETYEHISILEFNENAPDYYDEAEPGDLTVAAGHSRNRHVRDEEKRDFVKVADGVAIIELHQPITGDEVTAWCNSPAGKLVLAHWFEDIEPEEVLE
jgi:hypothetical protein